MPHIQCNINLGVHRKGETLSPQKNQLPDRFGRFFYYLSSRSKRKYSNKWDPYCKRYDGFTLFISSSSTQDDYPQQCTM